MKNSIWRIKHFIEIIYVEQFAMYANKSHTVWTTSLYSKSVSGNVFQMEALNANIATLYLNHVPSFLMS